MTIEQEGPKAGWGAVEEREVDLGKERSYARPTACDVDIAALVCTCSGPNAAS